MQHLSPLSLLVSVLWLGAMGKAFPSLVTALVRQHSTAFHDFIAVCMLKVQKSLLQFLLRFQSSGGRTIFQNSQNHTASQAAAKPCWTGASCWVQGNTLIALQRQQQK